MMLVFSDLYTNKKVAKNTPLQLNNRTKNQMVGYFYILIDKILRLCAQNKLLL